MLRLRYQIACDIKLASIIKSEWRIFFGLLINLTKSIELNHLTCSMLSPEMLNLRRDLKLCQFFLEVLFSAQLVSAQRLSDLFTLCYLCLFAKLNFKCLAG